MDENPFGVVDPISDSKEQEALDKTPAPHTLDAALREPASVGWVQAYVGTHQRWCPALRVLRRWSVLACVLLGALLALNATGWLSAKSTFREAVREGVRAELKDTLDEEIRKELEKLGVIHAELERAQRDRQAAR